MRIPMGARITVWIKYMPKPNAITKKAVSAVSSAGPAGPATSDIGATVKVPKITAKNINIG